MSDDRLMYRLESSRKFCYVLQGLNSVFSLRLEDITGAFTVEPTQATGSTSVNIRVTNGSLDYENPNQRKFIILVSKIFINSLNSSLNPLL